MTSKYVHNQPDAEFLMKQKLLGRDYDDVVEEIKDYANSDFKPWRTETD